MITTTCTLYDQKSVFLQFDLFCHNLYFIYFALYIHVIASLSLPNAHNEQLNELYLGGISGYRIYHDLLV